MCYIFDACNYIVLRVVSIEQSINESSKQANKQSGTDGGKEGMNGWIDGRNIYIYVLLVETEGDGGWHTASTVLQTIVATVSSSSPWHSR